MTRNTADPMVADIHQAVRVLVRLVLPEGELLARFLAEPWTLSHATEPPAYVVTFASGEELCRLADDDVAWAVGVIRARRGDASPGLLN